MSRGADSFEELRIAHRFERMEGIFTLTQGEIFRSFSMKQGRSPR